MQHTQGCAERTASNVLPFGCGGAPVLAAEETVKRKRPETLGLGRRDVKNGNTFCRAVMSKRGFRRWPSAWTRDNLEPSPLAELQKYVCKLIESTGLAMDTLLHHVR